MRIALAVWGGRISPVFDVARRLLILDVEDGAVVSRAEKELSTDTTAPIAIRVDRLVELDVDTLICGAVSRPLFDLLSARGVHAIAFIAGEVDEVIEAALEDRVPSPELAMPGLRPLGGASSPFFSSPAAKEVQE